MCPLRLLPSLPAPRLPGQFQPQWGLGSGGAAALCRRRSICPSGLDYIWERGPVGVHTCVCTREHVPRYRGNMSEQVRGFRPLLQKQQPNCCLACKEGPGGERQWWGTGLVCRSWGCHEAEGADAFMQPWRAELGPREGLSREAGLAQHVPGHRTGSPARQ